MKRFEFSKLILSLVMATYFIGLVLGIWVVIKLLKTSPQYLATVICGVLSYIGAPVSVAIAFYSYKAKAENVEKIKNLKNVIDESLADA